jgi:hypothetical protein
MSQAGTLTPAPLPVVPTTYVEDTGVATPALGLLNVITGATDGIATSGAGNTVTISMRNRVYGVGTTIGAVTGAPATFVMSATTGGSYCWDISVSGYDPTNNLVASYTLVGATKTDGAGNGALVPGQQLDEFEDAGMAAATAAIAVVGNTVNFNVTGVAAHTINWKVVGFYTLIN